MSFWNNRKKMRQRTEEVREGIPENPVAPPAGPPGSPAAEHREAQEKLTAACDQAAKNQPGPVMGGE
jgi:hypothetical protein